MDPAGDSRARDWIQQWKSAAVALAQQRRQDLQRMSDAEALFAAENLLSLVEMTALSPARRASSGLVDQQALLHRRARR